MSGSDNMSAWRVWLHPRRAARELAALCNQVCEAAEERASDAALIEGYEARLKELASLRERENEENLRRESDLKLAVEAAQMRTTSLEREKDHWESIEAQLHDLERQIDKAMDMKKRYERQIRRLHEQLRMRDMQSCRGEEVSELLDDGENSGNISDGKSGKGSASVYKENISLNMRETKGSVKVKDKSRDSDWLQRLPDDI